MIVLILEWFLLFPEHATRKLYLVSESAGGRLVPALADAIMDHNSRLETSSLLQIHLHGILLGNPCLEGPELYRGYLTRYAMDQSRTNLFDWRLERGTSCTNSMGYLGYDVSQFAKWLDRGDVRDQLHARPEGGREAFSAPCADTCIKMPQYSDATLLVAPIMARLLRSGVHVVVMYGGHNLLCGYDEYDEALFKSLEWRATESFAKATYKDIRIGGASFASEKTVTAGATLSVIQIWQAGHLVPVDAPSEAHWVLNRLLSLPSPDLQSHAVNSEDKKLLSGRFWRVAVVVSLSVLAYLDVRRVHLPLF